MTERSQSAREMALRRYFSNEKGSEAWGWLLVLGGLGSAFLAFGSANSSGTMLLLGAGLALAGYAIIRHARGRPNDQQIDTWFNEGLNKIVQGSRTKLNLAQLAISSQQGGRFDPLPIVGPILWETHGVAKEDLVWKRGKDGVVRFGVYRVSVIHLTDMHLAAYSCDYNFLREVALNEETEEYHYVDVVGVTTKELASSLTLPTGEKLTSAQQFAISAKSGQVLEVVVDAEKLSKVTGSDKIPETGADKAVNVIRARLRDKKQEFYPGVAQTAPSVPPVSRILNQPVPSTDLSFSSMPAPAHTARVCPKCGAPAQATDKFCMACGSELGEKRRTCKRCGVELTPGAKYCAECGNKVH